MVGSAAGEYARHDALPSMLTARPGDDLLPVASISIILHRNGHMDVDADVPNQRTALAMIASAQDALGRNGGAPTQFVAIDHSPAMTANPDDRPLAVLCSQPVAGDVVAALNLRLRRSGAMSTEGPIEDRHLCLQMLDIAVDLAMRMPDEPVIAVPASDVGIKEIGTA